jgi:hypothetical protein
MRRDNVCVVTGTPNAIVASHLIPKHMGSDGALDVVTRFAGVHDVIGVHRYDPRIGILLLRSLSTLVDFYQLGFYHVTVSQMHWSLILVIDVQYCLE